MEIQINAQGINLKKTQQKSNDLFATIYELKYIIMNNDHSLFDICFCPLYRQKATKQEFLFQGKKKKKK